MTAPNACSTGAGTSRTTSSSSRAASARLLARRSRFRRVDRDRVVRVEKIEQLSARIIHLEKELARWARQIYQLNHQVRDLSKQLREAQAETQLAQEAHLATVLKNSRELIEATLRRSAQEDEEFTGEEREGARRAGGAQGSDRAVCQAA